MEVTLRAETGRTLGSRPTRRLRRTGRVPAVLYGRDLESRAIAVDRRELYGALHTEAGLNALISLDIDGTDQHLTMARAVDRHPVRGEIIHVDFVTISLTETTRVEVILELQGDPVGVREGGPAHSAGLRDGQKIRGWSYRSGDPTFAVKLQVEVDGQLRTVEYLPVGEEIPVPQFVLVDESACDLL